MDVEIVKKNGHKFRLSDYGVVQDFVVHSADRSVVRDPIEGRAGSVDYGVEIGDRTIEVPMIFKAVDLHDYAHLRDELYGLLDDSEPFYIREMRRPKSLQYDFVDFGQKPKWEAQTDNEYVNGKQYQVRLNNTLTPDQRSLSGEVSIEFVTSGIPYAETVYTTLELHDSGYSATAGKYGLVDNINVDKVKYRFETDLDVVTFDNPNVWEQGSINSTSGELNVNANNIRTRNYTSITPGKEYTLKETLNAPNLRQWWGMEYDNSDNFVGWVSTPFSGPVETTFIARGSKLKLRPAMTTGNGISPSDIGVAYIPELTSKTSVNTFNVWNAGNVTVEPESMYLEIRLRYASIQGKMSVKNKTTGDVFEFTNNQNRLHIGLLGMNVLLGASSGFRYSNRRFIRLAPGDNEFEISGGTFEEFWVDFKYMYK